MVNHKSVAIYVRVSTAMQESDGYSVGEQIDKLTKYCELQDWQIHQIYKDGGYSGSNLKRPAITQLIEDVKANKIDTVLVYKLDRLSRSLVDTMQLIEKTFNAPHVSFSSMSESFDTNTPVGKVMVSILATFAQFERENIRSRMKMGKVGRAKAGKVMTFNHAPFGYDHTSDRESYEINPTQAQIIEEIYSSFEDGSSPTNIAKKLNNEGKIDKPEGWTHRTVRYVLNNISYTGKFVYNKQIYQGNYEPIINNQRFEKVQAELKRRQVSNAELTNNTRPFRAKYMLSGMIFCSYCGSRFDVQISRTNKTHEKLLKYKCFSKLAKSHGGNHRRATSCPGPSFYRMPEIESEVINQIMAIDFSNVSAKKSDTNTDNFKSEIKKLDAQISRLLDLTLDDTMPVATIQTKIAKIQEQKQGIQKKIKNNEQAEIEFTSENAKSVLDDLKLPLNKCDYETQKNVVHKLIQRVELSADAVSITWRF